MESAISSAEPLWHRFKHSVSAKGNSDETAVGELKILPSTLQSELFFFLLYTPTHPTAFADEVHECHITLYQPEVSIGLALN